MRKYPVTAPSGRVYEAVIESYKGPFNEVYIRITVYQKIRKRWLLIPWTTRDRVRAESFSVNRKVSLSDTITHWIETREQYLIKDEREENKAYELIGALAAWDGVIKPKEDA
ncbi:hypothetical protein [Paenibacillus sp. 1P03SA]|uniref:hypothetical protein n=1 Tax=Paenibacillus sp. 1P03SA TaxID=3132294 RepID=UPI0039A38B45